MINNNNIEELRRNWLEIMDVIDVICKNNNIKYSLVGGTMLGAVRHGGFIPWDDDFDIGMLREDFNRFLEVSKKELNESYFLQTNDTDPEYSQAFAKIRKRETLFIESATEKLNINHGIFIDVFPYDNVPGSTLKRHVQAKVVLFFKRLANAKNNQYRFDRLRPFRYIGFLVLKFISSLLSINFIVNQQNRASQLYSNQDVEFVSNMGGGYTYFKQMMPKVIYKDLKPIKFENKEYLSFSKPEIYLKRLFGDYMRLPPLNEQGFMRHNVTTVCFDTNLNKKKNE